MKNEYRMIKYQAFLTILFSSLSLAAMALMNVNGLAADRLSADESGYTFLLLDAPDRYFPTDNTGNEISYSVSTEIGNPVGFRYKNLTHGAGAMNTLSENGYFFNQTAISGIRTAQFEFAGDAPIRFSGGWMTDDVIDYAWTETLVPELTGGKYQYDYDFDSVSMYPDYFKVSYEDALVTIISLTVTYSCSSTPVDSDGLSFAYNGATGDYSVEASRSSITSVRIPSFHDDGVNGLHSVAAIGYEAFDHCESLVSVVIPDSITSIGERAFNSCTILASAIIPDSVTSIGEYAFFACRALTRIVIPDGVTVLAEGVLYNCSSLTDVVLPDTMTAIGMYAFSDCNSLPSVMIPEGVTSISETAFLSCTSLITIDVDDGNTAYSSIDGMLYSKDGKTLVCYPPGTADGSFTVPDGVTGIADYAFGYCPTLHSVTMGDDVISIGGWALSMCTNLTSLTIGDNVTSIGVSAFSFTSITSIVIPDGVTAISADTFCYCASLESIVIPDSVTTIDGWAFSDCSSLTSIIISDNVITVGSNAFSGCISLTIYAEAASKPAGWDVNWNPDPRPVMWGYES